MSINLFQSSTVNSPWKEREEKSNELLSIKTRLEKLGIFGQEPPAPSHELKNPITCP